MLVVVGFYPDPQSPENHGLKPLKLAQKDLILHTVGVQVMLFHPFLLVINTL